MIILNGCINLNGLLKIKTTKEFEDSTVSKILELVENATSRKSKSEDFITRFARVYTPVVVFSAMALAILPPLFFMLVMSSDPQWHDWIYRALTFLVISCPCALVISVPLSFFAGIGGASREGVLIKGSNYLEALSKTCTVVFDKTGTLTKGVFEVTEINPKGVDKSELLQLAAAAEQYSSHPIAVSLKNAAEKEINKKAGDVEEIAGYGIRAKVGEDIICVGNTKLMESIGAKYTSVHTVGTVVYVSKNGEYIGNIIISDVLKENSVNVVKELKRSGIKKTVMLTGDTKTVAESVAEKLKIDQVYSELLPSDKVNKVEELLTNSGKNEALAFVGDGINDAPVLSRADIGIAMGAMGSDAAIEAADIVLMDDDPMKISKVINISKKCLRIVNENIWFSIGIKVACLVLGALGLANMWIAIFADVGVMVLAVLNAVRCLRVKNV